MESKLRRELLKKVLPNRLKKDYFSHFRQTKSPKSFKRNDISDAETYSIVNRMCETKGEEVVLILNIVESKETTFKECVKIVSSPVCVRS